MSPHNNSIKKIKSKLEGYKNNVCETKRVLFEAIKLDTLKLLEPVSKTLQECSLLTPKLMSVCRSVIKMVGKLTVLLQRDGEAAFERDDIFPMTGEILQQLDDNEEELVPERQTRNQTRSNPNNDMSVFHSYLLNGSKDEALVICKNEYKVIFEGLQEALKTRLEPLLESDLFKAISMVLDSESYQFLEPNVIFEEIEIIVKHFETVGLIPTFR